MICTLNPHFSAIKETLSTLKFAQRAKMIRTQAVVNEESGDSEYWKKKFNDLKSRLDEGPLIVTKSHGDCKFSHMMQQKAS
jgi:hypothetical protein